MRIACRASTKRCSLHSEMPCAQATVAVLNGSSAPRAAIQRCGQLECIGQTIGERVDAGADHFDAALQVGELRLIAARLLLLGDASREAFILLSRGVVPTVEHQRPHVPEVGLPADLVAISRSFSTHSM
jgi:hypothetical protein